MKSRGHEYEVVAPPDSGPMALKKRPLQLPSRCRVEGDPDEASVLYCVDPLR